jgi:hypothetical protein
VEEHSYGRAHNYQARGLKYLQECVLFHAVCADVQHVLQICLTYARLQSESLRVGRTPTLGRVPRRQLGWVSKEWSKPIFHTLMILPSMHAGAPILDDDGTLHGVVPNNPPPQVVSLGLQACCLYTSSWLVTGQLLRPYY